MSEDDDANTVSRRVFLRAATITGAGVATGGPSAQAGVAMSGHSNVSDEIANEKIRRALLSGPDSVTREATVAEMDAQGKMTVLRPGTNQWVCVPGNENIIGQADMSLDPMGCVGCSTSGPKSQNRRTPHPDLSTCSMELLSTAIPIRSIARARRSQLVR